MNWIVMLTNVNQGDGFMKIFIFQFSAIHSDFSVVISKFGYCQNQLWSDDTQY